MTKMIPPVPTSAVMMPTPKQKIGFSIESIVGNDANANKNTTATTNNQINNNNSTSNGPSSPPQTPPSLGNTHVNSLHQSLSHHHHHNHQNHLNHNHQQQQQQQQQPLMHHHLPHHMSIAAAAHQHSLHQHILQQQTSPKSTSSTEHPSPIRHDIQDIINRLHNSAAAANLSNSSYSPPHQTRLSPEDPIMHLKRERSPVPSSVQQQMNPAQRHQPPHTPPQSVSPQSSHPSSPPVMMGSSPSGPQNYSKGPIMMPVMPPAGLVRPFPVGPPPPPQQNMPDIKALPPYINAPPEMQQQHNPHLLAAAQFQMAAALQAGHVLGPAAAAAAAAGLPPHSPFLTNPSAMPRESYPLYPWLLSRHGRIFPHRFPGNFLLQPFRKPKRIRTAFSPSQLLKLEHAFESNQYVVGAERKALAQSLNLSETQVKVWFQNRRTKHKRMQQEDEKGPNGSGSSDKNSQNASCDEDDDELIDMEMDDCPSDDDLDASH